MTIYNCSDIESDCLCKALNNYCPFNPDESETGGFMTASLVENVYIYLFVNSLLIYERYLMDLFQVMSNQKRGISLMEFPLQKPNATINALHLHMHTQLCNTNRLPCTHSRY